MNETGTYTEPTSTMVIPNNVSSVGVDTYTFGKSMGENSINNNTYIGNITLTDLPSSMSTGEVKITRIANVLYMELYSADTEPHIWDAIYWVTRNELTLNWRPRVTYNEYQSLLERVEALESK